MATQSSDEYLKEYLGQNDFKGEEKESHRREERQQTKDLGSAKELDYITIAIEELPCSYFYPAGTTVHVRAAKVSEIQAFSMVDDTNFYDIYEKVNQMVSSCVFLKHPDQKRVPYTNLIDHDRWYLIFVIRELTFQKGTDLFTEVEGTKIPIKRGHFTFHEMDESISKYYDRLSGQFVFNTKYGEIRMAPPTIGLQKSFTDHMIKKVQSKKDLNQSFLKIVPYTLPGRTSITEEGIDKKLLEFGQMDMEMFQFLNQVVEKMSFGVNGVRGINEESGQEVRSEDIFPSGISRLFVQPSSIEDFLV